MVLKSVYLDYSSKEFYVTQDGYDAIRVLIQQHQLCGKCRQPIDPEEGRILVGKNLCLPCLLERQSQLTYVGVEQEHEDGDITYGFIDAEGIVHTSRSNYSDGAKEDIYSSIKKAGFSIP